MPACRTVLLAEDDENDAFLLRLAFEKAQLGHALIHMLDGQDVLDYLSKCGAETPGAAACPRPDLLILDIKMPRLTGFDVLSWLRARPQFQFPVVVLSSSEREDDKVKARELGAVAYHVKPGEHNELVQLARQMDQQWLKTRGLPPAFASRAAS